MQSRLQQHSRRLLFCYTTAGSYHFLATRATHTSPREIGRRTVTATSALHWMSFIARANLYAFWHASTVAAVFYGVSPRPSHSAFPRPSFPSLPSPLPHHHFRAPSCTRSDPPSLYLEVHNASHSLDDGSGCHFGVYFHHWAKSHRSSRSFEHVEKQSRT